MKVSTGIDINGKEYIFNIEFDAIYCPHHFLTKLIISENIKQISCTHNYFNRNLILPKSIKHIVCDKHALDNLNKYKHIQGIHIDY